MLKLSTTFLNSSSNINCSNINCSNINCIFNTIITNNVKTIYIGNTNFDPSVYNTALILTNQTPTSPSVLNDSLPILHLCRQGTSSQAFGARATFCLSRYQANGLNSRTLLDLKLAHTTYNNPTIVQIYSSGLVHIPGTLTIYNLKLSQTGNILSIDNDNYIVCSTVNRTLTFQAKNDYSIEFNINQSTPSATMNSDNLTINAKLTVTASVGIERTCTITGSLTSNYKWFKLSAKYSRVGDQFSTTWNANFSFQHAPYNTILNRTFIIDCHVINDNNNNFLGASKGFLDIINNLGTGPNSANIVVKEIYMSDNTVRNWYNSYTSWADGLNVYTYTTDYRTVINATCHLTVMILE
jgi:hypothetical protein